MAKKFHMSIHLKISVLCSVLTNTDQSIPLCCQNVSWCLAGRLGLTRGGETYIKTVGTHPHQNLAMYQKIHQNQNTKSLEDIGRLAKRTIKVDFVLIPPNLKDLPPALN